VSEFEYDPKDGWQEFRDWLARRSAIMLPPSNQWEIFRAETRLGVLVGYKNRKGKVSFNSGNATAIWSDFENDKQPPSLAPQVGQREDHSAKKKKKQIRAIMVRDGENCFFCNALLKRPFSKDEADKRIRVPATIEHFIPISKGGPNNLHNYVCACNTCNNEVGSMSVLEKVRFRDMKRSGHRGG
jgi:5-methylcytosine-specific restriction endonuclease McrA